MNKLFSFALAGLAIVLVTGSTPLRAESSQASGSFSPLSDFYDRVWIEGESGEVKSFAEVADGLSDYDVVFFGEFHGHSGIHLAQMQLFRALQEQHPAMTLSLEQFERDTQEVMDSYLAGEIGEKALQEDGRAWDNYEQSYRPLVEYAKDRGLPVIAANVPKSIVICVGRQGAGILDEIPEPDRGWVASELHLDDGAYMDKYRSFMTSSASHRNESDDGGADAGEEASISPEMERMVMNSFSAQVTRDDTMAESIANHLQNNPERKVLHLNGNFHSASHLGTVERLKARMPDLRLGVVTPVTVDGDGAPSVSDEDLATGDYIIVVRKVPEMFVSDERKLEYQRKVVRKRMGNKCEYGEQTHEKEE